MSKADYKTGKKGIEADYKAAKGLPAVAANARDICKAEAKGRESVALAELEPRMSPPSLARDVRIAKANANYSVADEKCDEWAGNAKDVVREGSKAALTSAKAGCQDAEETADANATANVKSTEARDKADKEIAVARRTRRATSVTRLRGGQGEVRPLAGASKDACVADAKARFSKS